MTLKQVNLHDDIAWGGGRAPDVPITPLAANRSDIETFLRDCVWSVIHVVSIKPDASHAVIFAFDLYTGVY